MAVVIHEIVTELVTAPAPFGAAREDPDVAAEEALVRRATERVLEILRREWDR